MSSVNAWNCQCCKETLYSTTIKCLLQSTITVLRNNLPFIKQDKPIWTRLKTVLNVDLYGLNECVSEIETANPNVNDAKLELDTYTFITNLFAKLTPCRGSLRIQKLVEMHLHLETSCLQRRTDTQLIWCNWLKSGAPTHQQNWRTFLVSSCKRSGVTRTTNVSDALLSLKTVIHVYLDNIKDNKYARLRGRTYIHTCRSYASPARWTNRVWPARLSRWPIRSILGFLGSFWRAKFPKMWDSLPRTSMKHRAKFDAVSFILRGELINCANVHTKLQRNKQTVTDISTPCLSACVDNKGEIFRGIF